MFAILKEEQYFSGNPIRKKAEIICFCKGRNAALQSLSDQVTDIYNTEVAPYENRGVENYKCKKESDSSVVITYDCVGNYNACETYQITLWIQDLAGFPVCFEGDS